MSELFDVLDPASGAEEFHWELEPNPFHELEVGPEPRPARAQAIPGGDFILDAPVEIDAVWGEGSDVLWARGEPFMLCGPDGVGKTTIVQQLLLAKIGIRPPELLGLPVALAEHVLYVAADRPRQVQRSLRRMVTEEDRKILNERVTFWKGPLPFDLTEEPAEQLADLARTLGADGVILDSLKDMAVGLSEDAAGSRVNQAVQAVIEAGIELVILHHQRKGQPGGPAPRRLADVYGSRWLTAGMGSVAMLWGDPGDLVVDFKHLKQPGDAVGPFKVMHDHVRGLSTREADGNDLAQVLAAAPDGLTVADGARLAFGASDPKAERNLAEKARRKFEGLVAAGKAERRDDRDGLARYFAREGA